MTNLTDIIAEAIGYVFAAQASGNNMPDMSGDPRNRIPAHKRGRFDRACAEATKDLLQAIDQAGYVVAPKACPTEFAHPFFVYDFMPQKVKFKSPQGDDSMALDVLQVRGWGRLTGQGEYALKLPHKVAAEIQDNFGKWVANTLNAAMLSASKEG